MAIEIINVGASPNDGNGDPIRDAFIKCNDNFDELDTTKIGGSGTDNFVPKFSGTDSIENSLIFDDGSFVGVNTTTPSTNLEVNGPDYSFSAGRQASNRKVSIGLNDNGQPSIQSFDSSNAPVNLTINPSGGNVGIGTLNPLGLLHLYKSGVTTRMVIDGDAGQSKIITYRTGGLQRFGMYLNNTAETGSNAGSDFQIRSYNDAGSLLSTPFFIKRSSGNIGIGTSSPNGKLHVSGGTSVFGSNNLTRILDGSETIDFTNSAQSDYVAGSVRGLSLKFYTNSGSGIDITSSGNVGIGTTAPSAMLTLNSTTPFIRIERAGVPTWQIQNNTIVAAAGFSINNITNGTTPFFINGTNDNVGIGTGSPSSLLEIAGSAPILTMNRTSGSFVNTIDFKTSGSSVGSIISNAGNGEQRYSIGPSVGWGGYHTFYTDTSERMRITSGGNVGIGITSPDTKLHVIGALTAQGSDDGTALFLKRTGNVNVLALNTNANGSWTMFDYASGSYTSGITQKSGNVGIGTLLPTSKLQVVGLPEYATNALAIAGGLTVGAFYHTAGVLKVVI